MADITVNNIGENIQTGDTNRSQGKTAKGRFGILVTPTSGEVTEIETEVTVEIERLITYHKRGYYPVTSQFEYWQTSDPNGDTPTGNSLIDVTIMVATDRS